MEEVIQVIINNGAALGCLIYFMYTQNSTQKELTKSIDSLRELIKELIIKLGGEVHD